LKSFIALVPEIGEEVVDTFELMPIFGSGEVVNPADGVVLDDEPVWRQCFKTFFVHNLGMGQISLSMDIQIGAVSLVRNAFSTKYF